MSDDVRFSLEPTAEGLTLHSDPPLGNPLRVDFVGGKSGHRRRFGGGRGQLIARACGLKSGITPQIVDATAGLGQDAFVLASLGARVMMIERVPQIAELLADGLERALAHEDTRAIAQRMQLYQGDASVQMAELVTKSGVEPEVIHLDPMFPHRTKSALVKKEMRFFQHLAGADEDAPRLLEAALEVATHRVVVKRPRNAPFIEGPRPQHVLEDKSLRYDLYVLKRLQ